MHGQIILWDTAKIVKKNLEQNLIIFCTVVKIRNNRIRIKRENLFVIKIFFYEGMADISTFDGVCEPSLCKLHSCSTMISIEVCGHSRTLRQKK